MKNRGENFVTTILMLAIVVIFSITTYFCLDIFEIINVPEQYSLVSLLGSKIELSTVAENIEDIVPDEGTIKKKIIVSTENKTDTNANVQAPIFDNVKEENNIAGDTSNFEASNSVEVENKYYYNQDLTGPLAIVIGNEGKGIGEKVKKNCDFLVKIPMKGKVQSLNASVSTGIVVYEAVKQRIRKEN